VTIETQRWSMLSKGARITQ